jgi:hypothetical protein
LASFAGENVLVKHIEGYSEAEWIKECEQRCIADLAHDRRKVVFDRTPVRPEAVVGSGQRVTELLVRLPIFLHIEALEVPDLAQKPGCLCCQQWRSGRAVLVFTGSGIAVQIGHSTVGGRATGLAREHMQVAAEYAVLQDRRWTLLPEELRLPRHLLSTVSGHPALPQL